MSTSSPETLRGRLILCGRVINRAVKLSAMKRVSDFYNHETYMYISFEFPAKPFVCLRFPD